MSDVTWFKIFPDGNQCFVVGYAGSDPIIALKTIKQEEICSFLQSYPNAHNIHVASAGEVIPRVPKILPEEKSETDPRWLPWAKTPKNDQKLAALTQKYGHPDMQGKYRNGWPEGITADIASVWYIENGHNAIK
jgi:hypothetical protein